MNERKMKTTIELDKKTKIKLTKLKYDGGYKSYDSLIVTFLLLLKKYKLNKELSLIHERRLKENGKSRRTE